MTARGHAGCSHPTGSVPLRAGQMAAAAADTLISPNPVARSWPGVAGLLKRGWQRPTRTSMAVLESAWATWAGVALLRTPRSTAAAPAICGAAADVPENRAQPSSGLVPSGGHPVPAAARGTSIGHPAGMGIVMYEARGRIPTRPDTVGTSTPPTH